MVHRTNSLVLRLLLASWIGASVLQVCLGQDSTLPEKVQSALKKQDTLQGDPTLRKLAPTSEIMLDKHGQHGSRRRVMFSPDEQVLATWNEYSSSGFFSSLSWRENIQLWNISTGQGQVIMTAREGQYEKGDYAFDSQSQRFAYFDSQTCFICNARTGEPVASVNHQSVFRTKFLADGRYLATLGYVDGKRVGAGFDPTEIKLRIWETETWNELKLSLGTFHLEVLGYCHLTDNGRLIFPVKEEEKEAFECWDVIRDQKLFRIRALDEKFAKVFGEKSIVTFQLFEVVGNTIRVTGVFRKNGAFEKTARFSLECDLENGELLSFESAFFPPDQRRVIGHWMDFELIRQLRIGHYNMAAISLSVQNRVFEHDGTWVFWNAIDGPIVRSVQWAESKPEILITAPSNPFCIVFNDTGSMAVLPADGPASQTKDSNFLTFWDLKTGKKFATIRDQSTSSFEFSTKGNLLLSRDIHHGEHHLNLWDLSTGNKRSKLEHKNLETSPGSWASIVSPSENFVATIGKDSIRLWDLKQFQSNPED